MELDVIKCGDCMKLMKELPDNCIDLIVTSPPYNKRGLSYNGKEAPPQSVNGKGIWNNYIDYNSFDDNMDEEEYRNWQIDIINECHRILKPGGSLFYNHKIRRKNNSAHFPDWVFNTNANFYQMIIWDRIVAYDVNPQYLSPNTELIFWLTKGNPNVYKRQAELKNEVWRIPPKKESDHPAPFPQKLVDNCINLTTQKGDIVFDPFMGSGTTAISAIDNDRHFIGFEMDEKYCELARKRVEIEKEEHKAKSFWF